MDLSIEEKLKEKALSRTIPRTLNTWDSVEKQCPSTILLSDAVSICKEAIKQACDQQKVLCYRNDITEYDDNGAGDLILRSPYPEGAK